MNFEKMLSSGLLKKQEIAPEHIDQMIKRARKDLETADYLLAVDSEAAYDYAYKAMMHSGRALIYSRGYRPSVRQAHKTIVEFAKTVLGSKFGSLTLKFDKMRKKRHLFCLRSPWHYFRKGGEEGYSGRKEAGIGLVLCHLASGLQPLTHRPARGACPEILLAVYWTLCNHRGNSV